MAFNRETLDHFWRHISILLNNKVEKQPGKGLSSNDYTTEDKQKLNSIDNKVDKVEGKQLSTNDFTNEEKTKLASLTNSAQPDWQAAEGENGCILNRTHYDAIMTKTLYNGTFTATAGTLTRINSIPDEMIVNYPDISVVTATFDGKNCTITASTNKWEFRDPNGQLVFTMNYDTAKGAQCLVSTYAGSGAHTLVIEADEITAVPLDEKYIPDTIPRRVDIPHMAMPDWNAAEGEAGYVKNRTHYEEKNVIVPNTIINVPSSDLYAALPVLSEALVVGEQYVVGFNNENYTCTAWVNGETIYLGNGSIYPGVSQGENVPFSIDTYPDLTAFLNTQVGNEYVVSIGTPGTVKQLDEKFIPDSIARVDNIPTPNWNASEGEVGYIENRTHWEELSPKMLSENISVRAALDNSGFSTGSVSLGLPNCIDKQAFCIIDDIKYNITSISQGSGSGGSGTNKYTSKSYTASFENANFELRENIKTYTSISKVEYDYRLQYFTDEESHNVSVYYYSNNIHQLDEKFIPSTIARTESVENIANDLTTLSNSLAPVATSGDYNDLINKPNHATEEYVTNSLAETEQWVNDNFTTKTYVDTAVSNLVDTAPDTLNTLNELAAALGDDPNFATTITEQLANKVDKVTGKGLSTHDYTTDEKLLLAEIAEDYVTSADILGFDTKIEAAHTHATTYKGSAFANGLYKITTNAEGHVTNATAVVKEDITTLGIPGQDNDTGATSVEVTGAGNAITTASYDATSRKLTLTKGATYTNNQGTITGVNVGASLSGGGTSGAVSISHVEGSAINKTSGLYKFSTDATSHVKSVTAVTKADITALGIPAQDTTYTAITNAEIDAICVY